MHDDAEKMLTRALELQKQALGAEHPDVQDTRNVLLALKSEKEIVTRLEPVNSRTPLLNVV